MALRQLAVREPLNGTFLPLTSHLYLVSLTSDLLPCIGRVEAGAGCV